jgi:hypothetical protein
VAVVTKELAETIERVFWFSKQQGAYFCCVINRYPRSKFICTECTSFCCDEHSRRDVMLSILSIPNCEIVEVRMHAIYEAINECK